MKNKAVLQEIKQIERAQGIVTPQAVLEQARSEASVLHEHFDWNDTEAAEKYRLWQARKLIKSVKIEWMGRETGGYWSAEVVVNDVPQRGYFSTEQVMSSEEIYQKVRRDALGELTNWQQKYQHIEELRALINDDEVQKVKRSVRKGVST